MHTGTQAAPWAEAHFQLFGLYLFETHSTYFLLWLLNLHMQYGYDDSE